MRYEYLHCSNKGLLKELERKENLYMKVCERILRCPHCKGGKGHFFYERDDREYCSDGWWLCDGSFDGHTPSKARLALIDEVVVGGYDDYWDYEIYDFVEHFEYHYPRTYDKNENKYREFDPEVFNQERHFRTIHKDGICNTVEVLVVWEEFVEELIKEHIAFITKILERAKKSRLLKTIFKEDV